jgi:transposase-like protein
MEVLLGQGKSIIQACKEVKIADATYYKWRKEYGGMQIPQAKRLKGLELENARLKRAVAELTLNNQILKDVAGGN